MALPALIGGGLAIGGLIGGLMSRPKRLRRGDVNVDPRGLAMQRYNELRDPTHMFGQFRQLGRDSAGSLDSYLQRVAATGGSERMARLQQGRQQQESARRALDAFGQFRLNANQQANQALGMSFNNERFMQQLIRQRGSERSQATMSAFNNVAGIGSTLLGNYFGS